MTQRFQILEKEAPKAIEIKAKREVSKAGLSGQKAQVGAAIDVSGSMDNMFRVLPQYGVSIVEGLFNQVMGLALNFDDNGTVPVIALDHRARLINEELTLSNIDTYIRKKVATLERGATQYAPTIRKIVEVTEKSGAPAYWAIFTDGQNSDPYEATEVLLESRRYPIFLMWFGIYTGPREKSEVELAREFPFLAKMDKLEAPGIDNAGFAGLNLELITQESLWAAMLKEFPDYLKKINAAGLTWNSPGNVQGGKRGLFGFGRR